MKDDCELKRSWSIFCTRTITHHHDNQFIQLQQKQPMQSQHQLQSSRSSNNDYVNRHDLAMMPSFLVMNNSNDDNDYQHDHLHSTMVCIFVFGHYVYHIYFKHFASCILVTVKSHIGYDFVIKKNN
jgi:hypothetical protein